MKNGALLIWALVALAVGIGGVAALFVLSGTPPTLGPFSSPGQQIYYVGIDAQGRRPIPRVIAGGGMMGLGMMASAACVDCHGEDGRGGRVAMMLGELAIPDIRYSALTSLRSEEGTTIPAWTDSDIARAIRDGIEPSGQRLKAPMPRWGMTDQQLTDVIGYLKELDAR